MFPKEQRGNDRLDLHQRMLRRFAALSDQEAAVSG